MEIKLTWLITYLRGFAIILSAPLVFGQEGTPEQPFVLQPPKPLEMIQPSYPRSAARNSDEGWVVVNYMVDPGGNPYESMVVDSTGPKSFERSALESLKSSKFEPATLNGEPVDGSGFHKYNFVMEGGVRASRIFGGKYRKFQKALSANEMGEAIRLLEDMEKMSNDNRYEAAFVNLSKFHLGEKNGDIFYQMTYLKKALAYGSEDSDALDFLEGDTLSLARAALLRLQLQNNYLSEALSTYQWMHRDGDTEYLEFFKTYIDKLELLKEDDTAYKIDGRINNLLPWYIDLFKTAFYLDDVDGELAELKLRCQGAYRLFPYEEDSQYNIPNSWGKCQLEVIGSPNTTFSLIQFAP